MPGLWVRTAIYSLVVPGGLLLAIPLAIRHIGSPPLTDPAAWAQVLGWCAVGLGAGWYLHCALAFVRRGRGTPNPLDPPRSLVVSGPYRWSRNPMYLGIWSALLGQVAAWPSWPMIGYLAGSVVAIYALVRGYEEPRLRRRFGAAYRDYCARTGRFLPRIGRQDRAPATSP